MAIAQVAQDMAPESEGLWSAFIRGGFIQAQLPILRVAKETGLRTTETQTWVSQFVSSGWRNLQENSPKNDEWGA